MEFIRENLLKVVIFIIILVVAILVFTLIFRKSNMKIVTSYSSMEQSMVAATKKYVNKNQKLLPKNENENSKVNLDTLVDAKHMNELYSLEDENIKCTGYTEILYRNNKYIYVPYLKCGKYYETKTLSNYIRDNETIVTSGSGLYQMGDTLVYRGESPKNYVGIGNRLYRIIDIKDDEIRLISVEKLRQYFVWDNRYNIETKKSVGVNDYSISRLKDSLNQLVIDAENDVEDGILSDAEYEKMVAHDICVGKRSSANSEINYDSECQTLELNQKVSLILVSDYARASIDPNCKTIYDKSCINYNYFSKIGDSFRTITATSDNTYQVFNISDGVAELVKASATFKSNIVVYINNMSLYKGGNGTYENPYVIR